MKTKKKILSMLLAVCLIMGMLPQTVFATESGDTQTPYALWVGGVQVTSGNASDVSLILESFRSAPSCTAKSQPSKGDDVVFLMISVISHAPFSVF